MQLNQFYNDCISLKFSLTSRKILHKLTVPIARYAIDNLPAIPPLQKKIQIKNDVDR